MAQKFVGIDLGSHHVKVVVLTAGFRGAQVVDVIEEPVGEPPVRADGKRGDPLGHVLAVALGLLRTRGLLGQPIAIALPASLPSYRLLNFPFSDERKIAQLVPFESEGQFPVPMEQLVHGHVIVPARDGGGRALVVAAKREKVEQISSLFRRAGAEVKVVTTPAIAAAQVTRVHLPTVVPGGERSVQPAALLIDLGHQYTHFVALGPRGPLAVRVLRRGGRHLTQAIANRYGIDVDAAVARKHETPLVGATEREQDTRATITAALEPVLRELDHTRLWLRATYHVDVQQLVLAGGGADEPGLADYLAEETHLPVHVAAPEASGLKVPPGRTWTTTLAALGAAYAAARRPLVQLHDDAAEVADGGWLQERMSSIVAIGIAVAAFGALDTIARVRAAEKELGAYKQQLAEATQPIFGESLAPREIDAKLAEAEGQDLMRSIPDRGALEVLSMITSAATPSDLDPAKQAAAVAAAAAAEGEPTEDGTTEGAGGSDAASPGSVAPNAGIVMSDELTISSLQIRERKIELSASANIPSAQDRLASKLGQLGCITNIAKGRVKGDTRRSFDMTMDSTCYRTKRATEEETDG